VKRAHRSAHPLLWLVVTPLALILLVLAVALRPDAPVQEPPPAAEPAP